MTDDLVKRLRDFTFDCFIGNSKHMTWQAADLIEELEKQLYASNRNIMDLEDKIENLEYEIYKLETRND